MGCNCGKGRAKGAPVKANTVPVKSTPQRPVSGAKIGPTSGQTQSFVLRLDSGRTASFGSLLEARAALARAGGRGSIA